MERACKRTFPTRVGQIHSRQHPGAIEITGRSTVFLDPTMIIKRREEEQSWYGTVRRILRRRIGK